MKGRSRVAGAIVGAMVVGLATGLLRRSATRLEVVEESMSPALEPGDYLVVVRPRQMERGKVVVFPHPRRPSFALIKRIVGLPGELVEVAAGQVHINGRVLAEPWANGTTTGAGSWQLGPTELFVLGDNRSASADDSREAGPLAVSHVQWQAIFRYWPAGRLGRLRELEPMTY